MRPHLSELTGSGAAVAFVGNGAPHFARAFDVEFGLSPAGALVLTDPTRAAYRAAGWRRGVAATIGPFVWRSAFRWLRRGHRGTHLEGDAWQQGGTLVVAPGDRIVYRHADRWTGDHAPLDAIRGAVARVGSDPPATKVP